MLVFELFIFLLSFATTRGLKNVSRGLALAKVHLDLAQKSLYKSSWPADHGDVARSKYTVEAGFPSEFTKLTNVVQKNAPQAIW